MDYLLKRFNLLDELFPNRLRVHKITFEHSYYPVRVGDAVILNYERAGLKNVKAKITAQSIKCETGCSIQETAVYTTKLWR